MIPLNGNEQIFRIDAYDNDNNYVSILCDLKDLPKIIKENLVNDGNLKIYEIKAFKRSRKYMNDLLKFSGFNLIDKSIRIYKHLKQTDIVYKVF